MDGIPGLQPGSCLQGVEAVAGELVRGDVAAEDACLCSLAQQVRQELVEVLLGMTDVLPLAGMRTQLIADAGAAVLVLAVAAVLSVYKPRGITKYGRTRAERQQPAGRQS